MALTSIPNIQTGDEYRDRALLDLINAEREMRSLAEGSAAQMRKLLHTLAFRLAGGHMEDIRRTSPGAPDNWKAEDWTRFFNAYVMANGNGGGWAGSVNTGAIQAEIQNLKDQVEKEKARTEQLTKDLQARDASILDLNQTIASLQRSLTQYRNDLLQSQSLLEEKNQQIEQLQSEDGAQSAFTAADEGSPELPPAESISVSTATSITFPPSEASSAGTAQGITLHVSPAGQADQAKTAAQPARTANQPAAKSAGSSGYSGPAFVEEARFKQMVVEMQNWKTPRIPERYKSNLVEAVGSEVKQRRYSMIVFLMARYGLSTNLEIDRVLATAENVGSRSNSIKAPINELIKGGILLTQSLGLENPFKTTLVCLRLSPEGKNLARIWGWEPIESDWERVIRLHQGDRSENREHTLGIMVLALHARFRGWSVEILPDVAGPTRPDLAVMKKNELYFVEFENSSNGEKDQKWRNVAALHPQHKVGICTFDKSGWERHAKNCHLLDIGGVATDLQSLIFHPESKEPLGINDISSENELWRHRW